MKVNALAKSIVAGVIAVLGSVTPLIGDGVLTSTDIVQVALFVLSALGVYAVPNGPQVVELPTTPELPGDDVVSVNAL